MESPNHILSLKIIDENGNEVVKEFDHPKAFLSAITDMKKSYQVIEEETRSVFHVRLRRDDLFSGV